MRRVLLLLALLCGGASGVLPAAAQQAPSGPPPSYAESLLTHYAAFHATAVTHELAHILAALATGGEFRRWEVRPFSHSVDVTWDAEWKNAVIRLAGPVANRLTPDLPRWIHAPPPEGFYTRFTGAYAFQSRLQPLYNSLISWLPDSPHDMRQAAAALTDTEAGEYALLGAFTAAAALDVWLQRDAIRREYEVFYGLRTVEGRGSSEGERVPVVYAAVRVRF
jgi:hypothetical protein